MLRSLLVGIPVAVVVTVGLAAPSLAAVPTMTHLWNFDTDYNDSIGTYNGTASGGVSLTTGGGGMVGEAAYFDGNNGKVDVAVSDVLPSSGPFAISFWENANAGSSGYFVSDGTSYNTMFMRWTGNPAYLSNQISSGGVTKDQPAQPTTVTQETWNQHVVAYNTTPSGSNQMVWYVNGQVFNGGRGLDSVHPWTGTGNGLVFGNRYDNNRDHKGYLDEMATWAGGNFDAHMAEYYYQNGTLAGYAARTAPVAPNKQVLQWKFDGNLDEVGGVLNGTGSGTIAYDSDSVQGGQSLYLDGTGGGVSFDQSVLGTGGSFSVSLWTKAPDDATGPNSGYLLGTNTAETYNLYLRWESGGDAYLTGSFGHTQFNHYGDNGTLTSDAEPEPFALDQWQHMALVYDDFDKTASWYLDGVLLDTMTIPGFSLNDALWLGNRSDGNRSFRGWIDDLRIYNHALAPNEVQALVPEPSILVLLFGSLATLLGARRR